MTKIDSFTKTQYFIIYSRVFIRSLWPGALLAWLHEWFYLSILILFGLIFPVPFIYFIDKVSGVLMYFYNGSPGTFSLNEQLAAEVEKIRILQSKQKFAKALKTANAVLARNPEHPEALYLKAQILSGFGKYSAAHACLNKLITIKDPAPDEKLRNWAISLRKEVLKRIRERQEPDRELRRKA